jgi:hypothetical protein
MGGATVNAVGTNYSGNSASTGENEVYGNIGNLTLPTLTVSSLTTLLKQIQTEHSD